MEFMGRTLSNQEIDRCAACGKYKVGVNKLITAKQFHKNTLILKIHEMEDCTMNLLFAMPERNMLHPIRGKTVFG